MNPQQKVLNKNGHCLVDYEQLYNNESTEAEAKKIILNLLKKDFHIAEEVHIKNGWGNSYRIDAIIWPKKPDEWANKDVMFGIEFKKPDIEKIKDISLLVAQCRRYYECKHNNKFFSMILACPLKFDYTHPHDIYHTCRIIDRLGIGEIRFVEKDLRIMCNEVVTQWSYNRGVIEGKINQYKRN